MKLRSAWLSSREISSEGREANCSSSGSRCFVSMLIRFMKSHETAITWAFIPSTDCACRMLFGAMMNIVSFLIVNS